MPCVFVVNPTGTHSEARTRLGASKSLAKLGAVRNWSHSLEAVCAVVAIEHHHRRASHHSFEVALQQQVRFIFVPGDLQRVSKIELFLLGFNDAPNSSGTEPEKQHGDEECEGDRTGEKVCRAVARR